MQEARLAKNWTPELAARETKIKVDRLRDLEADDYSNFASPTYARGFVRTYARALGLDEYKILRQLDNKLPDDDSANIVTETGVAYLPETAMPPRAAHRDYTGLYIVMALGGVVALAIAFVLFEAYRVGELRATWLQAATEPVAAETVRHECPTALRRIRAAGTRAPCRSIPTRLRRLSSDRRQYDQCRNCDQLAPKTTRRAEGLPVDPSVEPPRRRRHQCAGRSPASVAGRSLRADQCAAPGSRASRRRP